MTALALETLTVDDPAAGDAVEITFRADRKLSWEPTDRGAGAVRYALEHSRAVLEARIERIDRALAALDAMAERGAKRK